MLSKNKILLAALLGQTIISTQAFSMDDDDGKKIVTVSAKPKAVATRNLFKGPSTDIISLAQQDQDDQERTIRNALREVRNQNLELRDQAEQLMLMRGKGDFEIEIIRASLKFYQKNDNTMNGSSHMYHTNYSTFNSSDDKTGSSTNYSGGKPGWNFLGIISGGGTGDKLSISAPHSHSSQSRTSNNVHDEKQSLSLTTNREYRIEIKPGKIRFKNTINQPDKRPNDSRHNQGQTSSLGSHNHNNTQRNTRPSEPPKQITYQRPTPVKPHVERHTDRQVNNYEEKRPAHRKINTDSVQLAQSQNKKEYQSTGGRKGARIQHPSVKK